MARRRQAREAALQLLFQRDLNPDTSQYAARESLDDLLQEQELREFAWQIYVGTISRIEEIDLEIQAVAENWTLSRMAPTDRNVIRMGHYEMSSMGTAPAVVLDECVELARNFGNASSSSFVNGILDKLIPGDRDATASEDEPASSTTASVSSDADS
ncbi:MAG: transcription antitermination factor NusB [Planctomycetota bacterium]|nr:transcription antitermination factor NusB [Planctomycetota bacterium]